MPKVFSWAKKFTCRSPAKDTGPDPGTEGESDSEGTNSSARQSPEKKVNSVSKSSPEKLKDSNSKHSPKRSQITDKESSPDKQPSSGRRFSPEKRHYSDRRPSPEKRISSDKTSSSEKRHNSDRRPSPEKRLSPEKKNPGFVKRFASFRILTLDRKSTDKSSRSKSKSPEPALITHKGNPEKISENKVCRNPVNISSAPCREQPARSNVDKENLNTTDHSEANSEKVKEKSSKSDRLSTSVHCEDAAKKSNTDEQSPDTNSDLDETSNPIAESCPAPDIASNPRLSRVPGRQSISEKLYGEVIKEFDKIRNTKPKGTRNTSDVSSIDDFGDQRIPDVQELNPKNSMGNTSESECDVNQCINNNIINTRFKVSVVTEKEVREQSSADSDKRTLDKLHGDDAVVTNNEKDLEMLREDNTVNADNTKSSVPDQSVVTSCSANQNETSELRDDTKHPSEKDLSEMVPHGTNETAGTDVSKDESLDITPLPLTNTLSSVLGQPSFGILQKESSKVDNEQSDDISSDALRNVEVNATQNPPPPLIDLPPKVIHQSPKCSMARPFTITKKDSNEKSNSKSEEVTSVQESPTTTLLHISTKTFSQPLVNDSSSVNSKSTISMVKSAPKLRGESPQLDFEEPPEVTNQPALPLSLDNPTLVTTEMDFSPTDNLPPESNELQQFSSTPAASVEDLQNSSDDMPPFPGCEEEMHREEELSLPLVISEAILFIDESTPDMPCCHSEDIQEVAFPVSSDTTNNVQEDLNYLNDTTKLTEENSEPLVSKAAEIQNSPQPLDYVPMGECNSSSLKISTENTENLSNEAIGEQDNHLAVSIANEEKELTTHSFTKLSNNNEMHHGLLDPPSGENATDLEDTESHPVVLNCTPEETKSDNEVRFKEEILALLDESFDPNKVNIADAVISVNNTNGELKDTPNETHKDTFPDSPPLSDSLNSSFDSTTVDGKLIPRVAPRRLSRESASGFTMETSSKPPSVTGEIYFSSTLPTRGTNSQPTSMTRLNEKGGKKTDTKAFLNESFGEPSSEEGGGSLPSSPSVPRRKNKPHPVPAARSFHTLRPTPGSSKVTSDGTYKDRKLGSSSNNAPPRSPMPSVIHNLPPLHERTSTVSCKPIEIMQDDSTPGKEVQTSAKEETSTTQRTPPDSPSIPVPKERTELSLNPFDSDDEAGAEGVEMQMQKPADVSLNPFDSEGDDENEESTIPQTNGAKRQQPPAGYNPFDEDDDEETEEEKSSNQFSPLAKLNDSISSFCSQSSKALNESASRNPFDEDEDEGENLDYNCTTLTRELTGRQSLAVRGSSPLQREGVRASLPSSGRILMSKKKRQAPLPPGYKPPGTSSASTTPLPPRYKTALTRGESSTSLYQSPLRRDSTTSYSTLSLSSPKRPPPPRPPPPKAKSTSMAQLK